jgi:hypothetical protein
LLLHITSGQPSRGTELMDLQHCNTAHGRRRSIFLENGMVSFVTFCLKGYSITNSTKIIHRYVPREVSELLVYYLWLVLPFCEQLKLLALNSKEPPSPYLWAAKARRVRTQPGTKAGPLPHWDSNRLSKVLQREFHQHLNTTVTINLWRHAAISISRTHLGGAKFKRDYTSEPVPTWITAQTGHEAFVAANVYARGVEEAPGHVAFARAEYRALSRVWHSFLGFETVLASMPSNSLKRKRESRHLDMQTTLSELEIEAEVQRRVRHELSKRRKVLEYTTKHTLEDSQAPPDVIRPTIH